MTNNTTSKQVISDKALLNWLRETRDSDDIVDRQTHKNTIKDLISFGKELKRVRESMDMPTQEVEESISKLRQTIREYKIYTKI